MTRRQTIMALAKGFRGRAKNVYRLAIRRVEKGLQYAYKGRNLKRRTVRQEWITQVAGASREHGLPYSRLIQGLSLANIGVDRKIMAQLARQEPYTFRAIVEEAKLGLKDVLLQRNGPKARGPSVVPDAEASAAVARGALPPYEGPPLPPYPGRVKHFS